MASQASITRRAAFASIGALASTAALAVPVLGAVKAQPGSPLDHHGQALSDWLRDNNIKGRIVITADSCGIDYSRRDPERESYEIVGRWVSLDHKQRREAVQQLRDAGMTQIADGLAKLRVSF